MALHGHTKIELTNIDTGETRIIEENNIVTNALQDILKPLACGIPYTALGNNVTDDVTGFKGESRSVCLLTGGLLLFSSALEENVDNFMPPEDSEVVGIGTTIAYSGSSTMAGSYNFNESGAVENGYKHIWDFDTSHGNGQIACVCLTTRDGGYAGVGVYPHSNDYYRGVPNLSGELNSVSHIEGNNLTVTSTGLFHNAYKYINNPKNQCCYYFDYQKNLMIELELPCTFSGYEFIRTINNNTTGVYSIFKDKKVKLNIRRMPFTNFSIFDTGDISQMPRLLKEVEVEMPDSLVTALDEILAKSSDYLYSGFSEDEGYMYIWFHNAIAGSFEYISPNATLNIWKINVSDFTSEHIKVVNTTGKNINLTHGSNNFRRPSIVVTNKGIICKADTFRYVIPFADNTDVKQVTFPNGNPLDSTANNGFYGYTIGNKFYFTLTASTYALVLDLRTGVVKYRNLNADYEYGSGGGIHLSMGVLHGSNGRIFIVRTGSGNISSPSDYYIMIRQLPDLLVTINNLDAPVTKTASQTMKVIYTLTMEDD